MKIKSNFNVIWFYNNQKPITVEENKVLTIDDRFDIIKEAMRKADVRRRKVVKHEELAVVSADVVESAERRRRDVSVLLTLILALDE